MTLVEHLGELREPARQAGRRHRHRRGRRLRAVYNRALRFLVEPYCEAQDGDSCRLVVIDPLEGFATRIKLALYIGVVLAASRSCSGSCGASSRPACTRTRSATPSRSSPARSSCSSLGAVVAVLTFPKALEFLHRRSAATTSTRCSARPSTCGCTCSSSLAFGIAFEFPVLLVFLQLAGVLRPAQLRKWRRRAIVGDLRGRRRHHPEPGPVSRCSPWPCRCTSSTRRRSSSGRSCKK